MITKQRYAFDYQVPAVLAIDNGVNNYQSQDIAAKAAFDLAIMNAELNHQGNRWIALQRYKRAKVDARTNFVDYRRANFSSLTNTSKAAHDAAKAIAGTTLKSVLQMQDNFQNLPVEMSKWQAGRIIDATYNSYAIAGTTTAVYPAFSEAINLTTASPTFDSSRVSGNNITRDIRFRLESTIKYAAGNIVEMKVNEEPFTSYLWGYNSQYPIAEITNASYSDVSASLGGQAVIDQLNGTSVSENLIMQKMAALRTSIPNAHITSHSYKNLLGIASKTDPRGVTEYYEYDDFGRLNMVKDFEGNILKTYCYNYAGDLVPCPQVKSSVERVTIGSETFYARLQLSNLTEINDPNSVFHYRNADLRVYFYSDAACTVPYMLKNNVPIRYEKYYMYSDNFGYWDDFTINSGLALTGSSNHLLQPNIELDGYEEMGEDPVVGTLFMQVNWEYYLLHTESTEPFTEYQISPILNPYQQ